jgi:hypothetical protein
MFVDNTKSLQFQDGDVKVTIFFTDPSEEAIEDFNDFFNELANTYNKKEEDNAMIA